YYGNGCLGLLSTGPTLDSTMLYKARAPFPGRCWKATMPDGGSGLFLLRFNMDGSATRLAKATWKFFFFFLSKHAKIH
ncbi:MAG TPA: hypothetical protein K8V20_06205, partial [Subdoligranulum variabile]|nr:hypothetical protein [Subdoligranulum variabile]